MRNHTEPKNMDKFLMLVICVNEYKPSMETRVN